MAKLFNIGKLNSDEIEIDIPVEDDVETKETTTITQIKDFVLEIWDSKTMNAVKTMLLFYTGIIILFFVLTGIKSMMSRPLTIISDFNPSNKEWVISDTLKEAIDNGEINVSDITVTYVDHEVSFSDSRIIITDYETVIEDNNPQIYSDEYYQKLVKQGKNIYIRKYITLAD